MMTFNARPADLWMAAALLIAAVVALLALEWRRPDRRHRPARLGATVLAVTSLALLGLHPAWHNPRHRSRPAGKMVAALWTAGGSAAAAADPSIPLHYQIALPGAAEAPRAATVFPDAATLRRRFPEILTLQVFGQGLDLGSLDALRGLRVVFYPPMRQDPPMPTIAFVDFPRTLPLGEPLFVEGEVEGLPPGASRTLTLEAPDGTDTNIASAPADSQGRADFSLRAAGPPASGRFEWHLRLMPSAAHGGPAAETESLGIAVVQPTLPRVLVLESSPHFDTADLRHWFGSAGGKLISRTLVGQDRYRFASSIGHSAPEFTVVDANLLAGFDLVLADPAALAALTPAERDALLGAMTDTGLGVLTLGDETPPPAAANPALFPWQLASAPDAAQEGGEHLERPVWSGQSTPIAEPIPAAPVSVGPLERRADLIRDGQGRTLAAAVPRGRGQLAITLLHDSGRWLRGNDPAAFSAYWSYLFSRLARPLGSGSDPGRWTLPESGGGPIFVDAPVTLLWSGAASANASARVTAQAGTPQDGAALALLQDPSEPGRWQGTFWPRHAGWYTVSAPAGGVGENLDFYVDAVEKWPALPAARSQFATARFAEDSVSSVPPVGVAGRKGNTAIPAVCFFAVFLGSAGFLWAERRFSFGL